MQFWVYLATNTDLSTVLPVFLVYCATLPSITHTVQYSQYSFYIATLPLSTSYCNSQVWNVMYHCRLTPSRSNIQSCNAHMGNSTMQQSVYTTRQQNVMQHTLLQQCALKNWKPMTTLFTLQHRPLIHCISTRSFAAPTFNRIVQHSPSPRNTCYTIISVRE